MARPKCHFLQFNMFITHNSRRFTWKTSFIHLFFAASGLHWFRQTRAWVMLNRGIQSCRKCQPSFSSPTEFIPGRQTLNSLSKYMHHPLGIWNGEMVSFSSASVGLSSGTFPFSISTLPSITCVSTPLAAWTNFWRFQKTDTKSKSTWVDTLPLQTTVLLPLEMFLQSWMRNMDTVHRR